MAEATVTGSETQTIVEELCVMQFYGQIEKFSKRNFVYKKQQFTANHFSAIFLDHLSRRLKPETSSTQTVTLKLRKPKQNRKVKWSNETVDNEHLNKKKSKCCCIYEKPRMFGESSSEDEDDCTGHCHGHRKKCFREDGGQDNDGTQDGNDPGPSTAS